MNSFCVDLNLNLTPLTKDVSSYGTNGHVRIPLEDLSTELVDFFSKLGMEIMLAELFYNPPRRISRIHVDALGGDYSKVNFVYGGNKSLMFWYAPNPGVVKEAIDYTSINTRSVDYDTSEVTQVHRQSVKFPSIVQVGIPHNIVNAAEPRYCLSIVPTLNGRRLTMQETIEIFNQYITA